MSSPGIRPDIITYSSLMSTAAKAMQPVLAEQWLQKATETSLRPNTVCISSHELWSVGHAPVLGRWHLG